MTRLHLALLSLLLPGALAVPRLHNRHEKHHRPSGLYPTGAPIQPTGGPTAPYGSVNATSDAPTGTGALPLYSTVTVSPTPVTSNAAISAGAASASAVNGDAPTDGASGAGACGPATVTVTSANTVTVTVGAGAAGSSDAATSLAASTSPLSLPSSADAATYGNGTSSAGPIGTGTAPAGTGRGSTGLPAYSALPVYSGVPAKPSSVRGTSAQPINTVASASISTTLLSHSSASAASSYVAAVAASSAAAVGESGSTTTAAAFYQRSSQSSASSSTAVPSSVVAPSSVVTSSSTSSSSTSSSSSSASASPTSAPSTGNVKARGLAYQDAGLTDLFQTSAVGWGYNWQQTPGKLASGVQYVPMLHDSAGTSYTTWLDNAETAIANGSTHLLSFNEPEQPPSAGGSQMSVSQVIDGWEAHMKPFKGRAKLGSPAVTSQENSKTAGLGLLQTYLDSFGDDVDFICIHWYGTEFAQFQQHISDAKKVANGRPIWLTEFAHNDPAQATSFMAQALPWLDNPSNGVERYAYQHVDSTLTSGKSLSAAGKVYDGK